MLPRYFHIDACTISRSFEALECIIPHWVYIPSRSRTASVTHLKVIDCDNSHVDISLAICC